jgi:hypothetical protein
MKFSRMRDRDASPMAPYDLFNVVMLRIILCTRSKSLTAEEPYSADDTATGLK